MQESWQIVIDVDLLLFQVMHSAYSICQQRNMIQEYNIWCRSNDMCTKQSNFTSCILQCSQNIASYICQLIGCKFGNLILYILNLPTALFQPLWSHQGSTEWPGWNFSNGVSKLTTKHFLRSFCVNNHICCNLLALLCNELSGYTNYKTLRVSLIDFILGLGHLYRN